MGVLFINGKGYTSMQQVEKLLEKNKERENFRTMNNRQHTTNQKFGIKNSFKKESKQLLW